MRKLSQGFVLCAGLITQTPSTDAVRLPPAIPEQSEGDPRLEQLRDFFRRYGSPAHDLAEDFLIAADRHGLDWRLLPSISFVESGGGKAYRNNNILGWANCNQRFPTLRDGIHLVADRLANSRLYKDKSVTDILRTYNGTDEYCTKVLAVMERLGPSESHAVSMD